jgi:hypothetical protein
MAAEVKNKLQSGDCIGINEIVDYLLIVEAGLGTEGSLLGIAERDSATTKILRMNFKNPVFNDVIKKNLREAEENFPRRRFNPNNRMRSSLPPYNNNNNNAYNAFRSGFNANNNKGQFFQDGGTVGRLTPPR